MFDSKGGEMQIIIDLSLKMIIEQASSTKIVLVYSAFNFCPDSQQATTSILERLSFMFSDPKTSICVAITKIKAVEESLSQKRILSAAKGEKGAHVSF